MYLSDLSLLNAQKFLTMLYNRCVKHEYLNMLDGQTHQIRYDMKVSCEIMGDRIVLNLT